MRKNYVAPLVEDVKMDTLMVDYLGVNQPSAPVEGLTAE